MKPFLYHRLTQALLMELASGAYKPGQRFLSLRKICHLWKVSEPTARSSISLLVKAGLLRPVSRSGYRLEPDFQKQALLLLHTSPGASLPPPSGWQDKRWRLLRELSPDSEHRIGIILENQALPSQPPDVADLAALEATRTFFQEATQAGWSVLYFYHDATETSEEFILREIRAAKLDAVIVFRRFMTQRFRSFIERLRPLQIPVVAVFNDCEQTNAFSLNFNNIGAGFDAARLLMKPKDAKVAALLPERRIENFEQRLEGFLLGVTKFGETDPSQVEIIRVPEPGQPLDSLRPHLHSRTGRCTALFAPGISTFLKVKTQAMAEGWRIPNTIRVIGCGNPNLLPRKTANIELLALNFPEAGRQAFQQVRRLLSGEPVERMTLLPVPYVGKEINKTAAKSSAKQTPRPSAKASSA